MKRVIITAGPQFAGKSTFCKKAITEFPEIAYVSRDDILNKMFGTAWLDPYTGLHLAGVAAMWDQVRKKITEAQNGLTLILDAWNGSWSERFTFNGRVRSFGADRVDVWYFVTPARTCYEWSLLREPVTDRTSKWRELTVREDHQRYHGQRILNENLFENIYRIDPTIHEPRQFLERKTEQLALSYATI